MAILNTAEGRAHVEILADGRNWNGYILLGDDPGSIRLFDCFGPQSITTYEGSVLAGGKYYFANGKVKILKIQYSDHELRVDFRGIEQLFISKALDGKPNDYVDEPA